jgi:hypothetical protein
MKKKFLLLCRKCMYRWLCGSIHRVYSAIQPCTPRVRVFPFTKSIICWSLLFFQSFHKNFPFPFYVSVDFYNKNFQCCVFLMYTYIHSGLCCFYAMEPEHIMGAYYVPYTCCTWERCCGKGDTRNTPYRRLCVETTHIIFPIPVWGCQVYVQYAHKRVVMLPVFRLPPC